ncbi:Kiwa anti-phage protein KwaB-like domain-containing protein [Vibrio fluvialis]
MIVSKVNSEPEDKDSIKRLLDQQVLENKLSRLKNLNLSEESVELFVINNATTKGVTPRFKDIKQLNLDENGQKEFLSFCSYYLDNYNHVRQLTHTYTVQDNRFYHVPLGATDFTQMIQHIEQNELESISKLDELKNFNAYVVKITINENGENKSLWAFHYFAKTWDTKQSKSKGLIERIIDNNLVATVSEQHHFQVNSKVDFFCYSDDIFISDVSKFETAMDYQERLKDKTEEAINNLCSSHAMSESSKNAFKNIIGKDKHLMRQLAVVEEKGYYKDTEWFKSLIAKVRSKEAEDWLIEIDDHDQIVMKEDKTYIKEILTLLQNKRVVTLIDNIIMDVDGDLIPVGKSV